MVQSMRLPILEQLGWIYPWWYIVTIAPWVVLELVLVRRRAVDVLGSDPPDSGVIDPPGPRTMRLLHLVDFFPLPDKKQRLLTPFLAQESVTMAKTINWCPMSSPNLLVGWVVSPFFRA